MPRTVLVLKEDGLLYSMSRHIKESGAVGNTLRTVSTETIRRN